MLMNGLVRNLEAIFRPVVLPLITKLLKPLQDAKKLPGIIIKKIQDMLKAMLGAKETSLRNYVLIGQYYVSKRLLLFIALALLVLAYFIFIKPPAIVNKWFNRVPVLQENTPKTLVFSGKAKVITEQRDSKYEGDLADGLYTGKGKLYGKPGVVLYEGEFDKGQKNGLGTLNDDQGRLLYKGQFVGDAYNGQGTLYTADQKISYIGEFQNGLFGGAGKLFYPNGALQYDGAFHTGQYSGAGKLFTASGTLLYEGEFAAGEYNGAGKLFTSKGILLYDGQFKNGRFSGEGSEFYENGLIKYKGLFAAGMYNGEGTAFSDKGTAVYKGSFLNGVYQGAGEAMDDAGKLVYKGDFKNGVYEGVGTLFDADGAPLLKSFFLGGAVHLQGFIGLSSKKLEDLLGKPGEVTMLGAPDPLALLAAPDAALDPASLPAQGGAGGAGAAGAGAMPGAPAASEIAKLQLSYPNYQMSFNVETTPMNPKEATVTTVMLWGSKPLAFIQPAVETFADPAKPNALGYRILELKQPSLTGGYTNSYYKDDFLLTFTHRNIGDAVTQLEIIPINP
ncbi:MAG: hypothetical protein K0S39_3220 [Paenibacillus sp.]|jgi:hypothetical protein|nr:hypothetical protein [Paenibacillus sp.]